MKKKAIFFLAVSLGITNLCYATPEDAYDKTMDIQKIGWMDKGMEAAKSKLKDPDSAQFRGVYFHRGADNIPVTCGEINAKNGFGGYSGYQKFISAGRPDLTFMETQVDDFSSVWSQYCL